MFVLLHGGSDCSIKGQIWRGCDGSTRMKGFHVVAKVASVMHTVSTRMFPEGGSSSPFLQQLCG